MKVLIVEDENLAIKRLQKLLTEIEEPVEVQGVTKSIAETVEWLSNNTQPDLILLDIELADGQSFEIFNQVHVNSVVIFTTSYDEYALKAFRLNSIDYLLKPIGKDNLEQSIKKYKNLKALINGGQQGMINIEYLLKDLHQRMTTKSYRKRFLVKYGNKFISVDADETASVFVEGRLVFLKTFSQKKYNIDFTMDELEELLDPSMFFRINRSCYVARKSIKQIEEHLGNRLYVHTQPEVEREPVVSREKVALFKQWMES